MDRQSYIEQQFENFPFKLLGELINGWENAQSFGDVEMKLPGGFSGTTYVVTNPQRALDEHNPVIVKLYSNETRSGIPKEIDIVKILSDIKWGPHVYYVCDTFRIEQFQDARNMNIWEMRNPHYVEQIIMKLMDFDHHPEMIQKVQSYFDGKRLSTLDILKYEKYPKFIEKIPSIIEKIDADIYKDYKDIIMDMQKEWVDTNLVELIDQLFPEKYTDDDLVLSHNDCQQGNILVYRKDQAKIVIIDYEDTSFGPKFLDISSFLGCFMKDNEHPEPPYIKIYYENTISEWELRYYTEFYLKRYHQLYYKGDKSLDEYLIQESQKFYEDLICGIIFFNIYFGVWGITYLREEFTLNHSSFFTLAKNRILMNRYFMNQEFVKKVLDTRLIKKQII
ncbi:choline ethanolamine kinase family protein [Stylonychia lemnae]|uniref:Choline ethanolamine kinase family protein n=1 Tax=Stylonychia lemnae TaxID=5949 RepID=A0A078AFT7_STYLE|nr:choline ethanolamine kinase family protein [Stylonychia lemnae]|eukprot:CDW81130.1 choline ethanolamine kinase family protein [Stylonychia lemnae]